MLIKVTNQCDMGCSHCMEGSTPKTGQHMSEETFQKALGLSFKLETLAWAAGLPRMILLSGGECTEHPQIVSFVEKVYSCSMLPVLITNGAWLGNKELRESILRPEWRNLMVQVTNDPRFYPRDVPHSDDPRVIRVPSLSRLIPLGRAAGRSKVFEQSVPARVAPSSFNFRSMTRHYGDVRRAILHMRTRAAAGLSGHCTPSITHEGDVVAGEARFCFKIGTVDSSSQELTEATIRMKCNACGLVDGLSSAHKEAIGEE